MKGAVNRAVRGAVRVRPHGAVMSDASSPTPVDPPHRGNAGPTRRGSRLGDRLDAEWADIRTSRRAVRRAATWRSADGSHPLDRVLTRVLAAPLPDLGEIVAATQRGAEGGDDDLILLRLVVIARTDDLACRLVVQRLLPALIHGARRYCRPGHGGESLDATVAALCLAIHTYDVDRRTRHVAASLTSDTIFQAFRKARRAKSSSEVVAPHHFADTVDAREPSAFELLAVVVRDARRAGTDERDLTTIRELVVDHPSTIAARHCVTTRAVRMRRERAVANIRVAIGVAAERPATLTDAA